MQELRRGVALLCLFATTIGAAPQSIGPNDALEQRALALLKATTCAQSLRARETPDALGEDETQGYDVAQSTPPPPNAPMPSPSASASFAPPVYGPGTHTYATPFPFGAPGVTPPPIPSPTPTTSGSPGPVFLVRPSGSPTISPSGPHGASPSPSPSAAPTLQPGYVAVLADRVEGSTKPGAPGDATGNVNIFYQDEILVGERAHYDGKRTIVVSGKPYIINRSKDSILYADAITFDTVDQTAKLTHGRGESAQGVEKGLVHFNATQLQSTSSGVSHGTDAYLTTCENARGGYHLTGKTIDVKPGDRIVITKAILWLGAAAVFFLPRVVIPLRSVQDERQRPSFFPDIGYDADEGFYVRTRLGFGQTPYYYGYYRLEYYTRVGLGLGYVAFFGKRNGKRQTDVDFFRKQDRRVLTTTYNIKVDDTENFSRTLRALSSYTFNSNFGALTQLPPNSATNIAVQHAGQRESQTYSFSRNSIAGQSNSDSYGFTDTHTFTQTLTNNMTVSLSHNESSFAALASSSATGHFNDLLHWAARGIDYQLTVDKNYSQQPFGIDKVPELEVRPNEFFPHFIFPLSMAFTGGQYTEPANPQGGLTTSRGDLNLNLGPALYHFLRSDFSASLSVDQYAYATGDLKAAIRQNATLSTIVNRHITNSIQYSENNYNGPALVPFQTIDQQPTQNYHSAQDVLRLFNQDYYNLQLGFTTNFNMQAQPVTYQLTSRPSRRSYVVLGGQYVPGPGNGFPLTNLQVLTPFGRGSTLQLLADLDWKNKGRLENKTIYYSHIIGDCYQVITQYNEQLKAVNVTVNLLALPSRSVNFTLGGQGPVIPTSLNF